MENFSKTGDCSDASWILFLWSGSIGDDYVVQIGKLSVLQPMLSLNYVLSIVLAAIVLKEKVSLVKCIGVLIIIGGVIMIVGGDEE